MTDDDWLPPLLEVDWNDYAGTVERAHAIFQRDFGIARTRPSFRGRRLGLKHHPAFEEKGATFWHMVTEGKVEADRTPDRARLERIGWPRAIITNADVASRVRAWCVPMGRDRRWHLALSDFSYLVVLADRGEFLLPWTAFCVDREHQREKLTKAWRAWDAMVQRQKS